MVRLLRLSAQILFALLIAPLVAAGEGALVFGVYPALSPSQTVEQFAPLKDHLAKSLGRVVVLRSAPDFTQFIERTRAGEYDLIFTAPHMGRVAERRDGYRPLAQSGQPMVIVALVSKDSPVKSLDELRERSLAVGARMSMSYQVMHQALGRHGLELGREVRFVDTASFSNVLTAILRGEADAGATGSLLWDGAPAELRGRLREIYRSAPLPGFLLLTHARVGVALQKQMQDALFGFANTPTGKTFFSRLQLLDFRPIDAADLKRIDPYTGVVDAH